MTKADRLVRITQQLVGDIGRLEGVTLDPAGEQQLIQLITDAFETVGHIALDERNTPEEDSNDRLPYCITHRRRHPIGKAT